jgi:hypothetical protein
MLLHICQLVELGTKELGKMRQMGYDIFWNRSNFKAISFFLSIPHRDTGGALKTLKHARIKF